MPPIWPLVGRLEELELIEHAIGRPSPAGVVLAGEAGVGKTRLAQEALDLARSRGLPTAWAAATHASASLPFGALTHLLPEDVRGPGRPALLRRVASGLVTRAGDHRLVLGIDDAHLLDEASAALVHHVAATGAAFPVVSVRTGEETADAIVALWKNGLAERIEVHPLSRDEVESLVESVLQAPVEGPALHRLWEGSAGNALFLRELVLGGMETNTLVREGGVWRWKGSMAAAPRLVEVVEARLGHLEPLDRQGLEVLALGEPLELDLLESVTSGEDVERLEGRSLLTISTRGRRAWVRLAHPLYGEVIRARTAKARGRHIKKVLADALEATDARRREDLLRVATWRLDSEGSGHPKLLMEAAGRALSYFDYPLAERLARGAVQAGDHAGGRLLGEALAGEGRFEEADAMLRSLQFESKTDAERTHLAIDRARNLFWRLGRAPAAEEVVLRALKTSTDPVRRDELLACRAEMALFGGDIEGAIGLVSPLVERTDVTPPVTMIAAMTLSWGLIMAGRTKEVLAVAERATPAAPQSLDQPFGFAAEWWAWHLGFARFFGGDMRGGQFMLEQLYRSTVEEDLGPIRAATAFALGTLLRIRGRPRTALARLLEAVAYLREIDLFRHLTACLGELANAAALLGEVETANSALEEAEAHRIDSFRMDEGFIGMGRVWTAVARGEVSIGAAQALGLADAMRSRGMRMFEAIALHDAARLGAARAVEQRLNGLAEGIDGSLVTAFAAHARALAAGDPVGLKVVSTTFERMGAPLLAAEAAGEAALLHREAGLMGSALAAAARARTLATECEGARTPALDRVDLPLPLTPREREVAILAARGLSNREIAERLVVSVRTVDNHLHHVYSKLGVAGREELRAILGSRVLDGPEVSAASSRRR